MARDDGGAPAPAPAPAPDPAPRQVYLPAWQRAYDRMVKMLRDAYKQAEELSVERERLIMEIQFLESGRREREEISEARIQQIRTNAERCKRVLEAEVQARVSGKEVQIHRYKNLLEIVEDDLEEFKSCISNLAAENNELKEKMKTFENQEEISTENSDLQKSGKDIRNEIRKLKKAYKILRSEKNTEISALQAEKDFVWNQLKTMEYDYNGTIKSKSREVQLATEAAQKLMQSVDEMQLAAQKKDDEIVRLRAEVKNGKHKMSILEDELQKLRSLVKGKDLETDKNVDTSSMSKKDTNEARKYKSKRTSEVTPDVSRTSHVTPDRQEVKTNQKRKLSSVKSSLSCGNQRRFTRPVQTKAAVSPMLLPPNFTVPKLKTPTPH